MKYEAVHTLQSNTPIDGDVHNVKVQTIRPGTILDEAEQKAAGHDVEFLKRNGAIEELKGTETDEERAERRAHPAPPTTTKDATPGMGMAPKGEPENTRRTRANAQPAAPATPGPTTPAPAAQQQTPPAKK
jgi:hypothetical protein